MTIIISIQVETDTNLAENISQIMEESGIEIQKESIHPRGAPLPLTEIIVALGSAGAFTAFLQAIIKITERNKDREIVLETKKKKIILKGHSLSEAKELLMTLAPDMTVDAHSNIHRLPKKKVRRQRTGKK